MKYKFVFKILVLSLLIAVFGCGIKGRPLPPSNNVVIVNQVQSAEESKSDTATTIKDDKDLKNKSRKTKK